MNNSQKTAIINFLKNLDKTVLINLWNDYCSYHNMDDYIYDNNEYELGEMFSGPSAVIDALRAATYGNYKIGDDYVVFNGYGNLESFDESEAEEHIDFEILADYLHENGIPTYKSIDDEYDDLKDGFCDYYYQQGYCTAIDGIEFELNELLTEEWDSLIENIDFNQEEN